MAQKVLIQLVDDLDSSTVDNVETVRFGLDGVEYEIDLSEKNAARLRDSLVSFVAGSRRLGGLVRAKRGGTVTSAGRLASASGHSKEQSRAIRDWAMANGHDLADRGRIPASAIAAFEAAHN
jgi:hypothetical protein